MLCGFCSKFHTLFSRAKNLENRLRFGKVTENIKMGIFFETQCILTQRKETKNNETTALFYAILPGNTSGQVYSSRDHQTVPAERQIL